MFWSCDHYWKNSDKQNYVSSVYYFVTSEVFRRGVSEDSSLLKCNTASLGQLLLTFWRDILPSFKKVKRLLRMKKLQNPGNHPLMHCYISSTRIHSYFVYDSVLEHVWGISIWVIFPFYTLYRLCIAECGFFRQKKYISYMMGITLAVRHDTYIHMFDTMTHVFRCHGVPV
jgi:hypothetical protein